MDAATMPTIPLMQSATIGFFTYFTKTSLSITFENPQKNAVSKA
jgi:hypothetical protein